MSHPEDVEFPQGDPDDDELAPLKWTLATGPLEDHHFRWYNRTPAMALPLGLLAEEVPGTMIGFTKPIEIPEAPRVAVSVRSGKRRKVPRTAGEDPDDRCWMEAELADLEWLEWLSTEVEERLKKIVLSSGRAALRPPTKEELRGEHLISPRRRRLNRRRLRRIG